MLTTISRCVLTLEKKLLWRFDVLIHFSTTVTMTNKSTVNFSTTEDNDSLLLMCKKLVPLLSYESYKGQSGRIGIIGGSKEYTGAPYFAGISSLKVGADLVHIFCTKDSSTVIKSYSPELIVHPMLDDKNGAEEIKPWIDRLHAVVIGPGLGRNDDVMLVVKDIIQYVKRRNLPLVIDADGLWLVANDLSVIRGYSKAVLTPNIVEFCRIYESCFGSCQQSEADIVDKTVKLSAALGNVTIINKGHRDIITDGHQVVVCDSMGSPRRCGGQGDLLSGSLGTFAHWAHNYPVDNSIYNTLGPSMCGAYAACLLTRNCSRHAFNIHRRSTTTSDLISSIHPVFSNLFEGAR